MVSEAHGRACTKVVAGIPAYNEGRFIGSIVLSLRPLVDTVLVVDDGSRDNTAAIAEAAGAAVVSHPKNLGKGHALNSIFTKARELDPDALVVLDGDSQHRVEELPEILRPILEGEADIVVGSRYIRSSGDVPAIRRLGHTAVNIMTGAAAGLMLSDSQSGFRAFSRRAIEVLHFKADGFAVESEMQFLARDFGLRVKEVSISSVYHDPPKRNVLQHGTVVLNGLIRLVGQHRPLLFFGVSGLLMLVLGLWLGSRVVIIYQETRVLAIGYALITVFLGIVGTVSLFTGLMLHSIRALILDLKEEQLQRR